MIPRTAAELADALDGKRSGDGWIALCPAHNDQHTPNLKIDESVDGKILLHCFAGCEQDAVIDALKKLGLWRRGGSFSAF